MSALVGILGLASLFVLFGLCFRTRADCDGRTSCEAAGPGCAGCHGPVPDPPADPPAALSGGSR